MIENKTECHDCRYYELCKYTETYMSFIATVAGLELPPSKVTGRISCDLFEDKLPKRVDFPDSNI